MPDVLLLNKATALQYYMNGTEVEKDILIRFYGKDQFEPQKGRRESFADILLEAGKNAEDYGIPICGTAKEMADAYYNRLELLEEVFNEGWVANLADITQRKYYAWANIIPDSSRPFGFRLSYRGYDCDTSVSTLCARPYFKDSDTAIKVFKTFTTEYEGWMYYLNLSKQKNQ